MLKDLFSNRLFIGALAFFVVCVAGSLLYMHHDRQKGAEELARDEKRIKQLMEKPQPQPTETKTPVAEQTALGHFHADGTWHGEPHEAPPTPERAADPAAPQWQQPSEAEMKQAIRDGLPLVVYPGGRIGIDYAYKDLSPEEREQQDREQNQLLIDAIAGQPFLEEMHRLMTENPFPYSPEVKAKMAAERSRIDARMKEDAKKQAAISAKLKAELAELEREIADKVR